MIKCATIDEISHIFGEIDALNFFYYFLYANKGKENPYHNNIHTMNVIKLLNEYCISEKIPQHERKCLLISALFHDFNHSGGKLSDKENVDEAIKGFNKAVDVINGIFDKKISIFQRAYIMQFIRGTEYPYKPIENNFFRVLREADILSYEHDEWFKCVFQGICKENGLNWEENTSEKLEKLLDFHKNLVSQEIKTPFFVEFMKQHLNSFEEAINCKKLMCDRGC